MATKWEILANDHSEEIHFGKMNCDTALTKPICKKIRVNGYPTLLYFPVEKGYNRNYYKYSGKYDVVHFLDFSVGGEYKFNEDL